MQAFNIQKNDIQLMLANEIRYTKTEPHLTFRFLTSWSEYKYLRKKRKRIKLFLKMLKSCTKRLFKNYCKAILKGEDQITKLLAFSQLQQVCEYYDVELSTITEMIWEYEAYLMDCNYIYALSGKTRAPEDMRDFRE